jgi:UDP-galactose transporter
MTHIFSCVAPSPRHAAASCEELHLSWNAHAASSCSQLSARMSTSTSQKLVAFFGLVVIQTGVALLFKLSQRGGKYTFLTSSAQTTAEFCKLLISLGFFARDTLAVAPPAAPSDVEEPPAAVAAPSPPRSPAALLAALRAQISDQLLAHTGGLALLYCFNNQLAFSLFRWADAATVTLIKSASSIVSALLLWVLLNRPIAPLQWHAITLQVLGLFIVQYDSCKGSALLSLPVYLALFGSLFISSGAGVWNEHVLKTFGISMHVQNICLYSFGVLFNLLVFVFLEQHGGRGLMGSYFHGYNPAAVGVIFCQAVLGLVVTAVLKYADTVIRSFATACSISVLYAVNITFLGWSANLTYIAGCFVVFISTYLYMALAGTGPKPSPPAAPTKEEAGAAKAQDAAAAPAAASHSDALARARVACAAVGMQRGMMVTIGVLSTAALITYRFSLQENWQE